MTELLKQNAAPDERVTAEFKRLADSWYAGWSHKGRAGFMEALRLAYELGSAPSEIPRKPAYHDSLIEECAQVCERRAVAWDSAVREGSEQRAYEETVLMECAQNIRAIKFSASTQSATTRISDQQERDIWDRAIKAAVDECFRLDKKGKDDHRNSWMGNAAAAICKLYAPDITKDSEY